MNKLLEQVTIEYLDALFVEPVLAEKPDKLPDKFILVERLGRGYVDRIDSGRIAIQTYALSLAEAAKFAEEVIVAMRDFARADYIGGVRLENSYNFTDQAEKRYRYQSVFNITHY